MGRRLTVAALLYVSLVAAPLQAQEKDEGNRPRPSGGSGESSGQRAPESRYLGRLLIGDDAPDFLLPTMDGSSFSLRSVRGLEAVALLFLQRPDQDFAAYATIGDSLRQSGIRVLFVCAERSPKPVGSWANLWMLYDRRGQVARLFGAYDVVTGDTVPALFLLDRTGHVRFLAAGTLPEPESLSWLADRVLIQESWKKERKSSGT